MENNLIIPFEILTNKETVKVIQKIYLLCSLTFNCVDTTVMFELFETSLFVLFDINGSFFILNNAGTEILPIVINKLNKLYINV